MAKPLQHVALAYIAVQVAKWSGLHPRKNVFIVSSILPDLDFLLLTPIWGRVKGHRTITHSPVFQIFFALVFYKFGFGSLLGGMLLHSIVDSVKYPGIAWFWPFRWDRF